MKRLIFLSISLITLIIVNSCVVESFDSSISDGEIVGIGGWNVHATINCEPNTGPQGTPITITIYFDLGSSLVDDIQA
ncbi:MAG: hypothetical protein JSV25_16180 [Spirochaetota bacterium]|nr:MAG: hypothetical protein JSV25_16180 [Spirochaetota bacterium]